MFKKIRTQKYAAEIEVGGNKVPVEVILEPRNGSRFAVTRKKVIMRLPVGVSADVVKKELGRLEVWVAEVHARKPEVLSPFKEKNYATGQKLVVGKREYVLDISVEERKSHAGKLIGNTIAIHLSAHASEKQQEKAIETLLSRVVANDFYADMADRVSDINQRTFKRPIKNVYLKYNHSNWGSCSSDGNINLSTRLLFAPDEVQNYVILHELAHLIELNHSDRFWALVEQHMPDYPEKEHWLKVNGGKCHF